MKYEEPYTPLGILRYLEQKYPEVIVGTNTPLEKIMYLQGQRSVVLELIKEIDPHNHRKETL